MNDLLSINNLQVRLRSSRGLVKPVRGLDLTIAPGEVLGIVGESGSGKSITAYAILRILPSKISDIDGEINFKGENLLTLPEPSMRALRGDRIAIIFQEPMTSLNPVFTVGDQCTEVLRVHRKMSNHDIRERVINAFRETRIPDPERRYDEYPHQLSGGLRQRVMIAMAILTKPDLLIADEPTTALDVTIQAQILELLKELQRKHSMSMMLITHNFGIVNEMCRRVAVMYSGEVVELGGKDELLAKPLHPYTRALIQAIPGTEAKPKTRLFAIPGSIPDGITLPPGCVFHPRCPLCRDVCRTETMLLREITPGRFSRCKFAEELK